MIFLILCWAKLGLPNSSPRIEPSLVKWHTILAEVGSWFKRDQTSLDEKSSATPSVSFWFFGFWRKVGLTKASQQANGLFFFFLKKQANGLTLQKFYFFPPYLLASFWFVLVCCHFHFEYCPSHQCMRQMATCWPFNLHTLSLSFSFSIKIFWGGSLD